MPRSSNDWADTDTDAAATQTVAGALDDSESGRPARSHAWLRRIAVLAVAVAALALIFHFPVVNSAVAVIAAWALVRIGFAMLRPLAQPPPPPPEPGQLRKVKVTYRCGVCGTEVRMTMANVEDPEPPRHCMEDMEPVGSPQ